VGFGRLGRGYPVQPNRRTVVYGVVLTYGTGLWLVLVHHWAGAVELHEPPLAVHWLRDATLAFPAVLLAVGLVLRRVTSPVASAAATAVAASLVMAFGAPVHDWLFAGGHGRGLVQHATADALEALRVALPLAAAVTVLVHRRPRVPAPAPAHDS
jgi:hypothetical protein